MAANVCEEVIAKPPVLVGVSMIDVRAVVARVVSTVPRDDDALFTRMSVEFGRMTLSHPDYGCLAGRIGIRTLYDQTPRTFHRAMKVLYDQGALNEAVWEACRRHEADIADIMEKAFDVDLVTYPSHQSVLHLKEAYLSKKPNGGAVVERPSYMYMRMALGMWHDDFDRALETFYAIRTGVLAHAMLNGPDGVERLAGCFVQSIDCGTAASKYGGLREMAMILEMNGGAGSNLRGEDTKLFHAVVDRTAKDIPRGGNAKRPAVVAIYREPWETDFLDILKNGGAGSLKHIVPGMWTCDLFVRRLRAALEDPAVEWSFFDGEVAERLRDSWGGKFEDIYLTAERDGARAFRMPVLKVMDAVCDCFQKTGTPCVLFKDSVNARCNQNNRGTIRGSNLSGEAHLYSSPEETGVCIMASIRVSEFLIFADANNFMYDFDRLAKVTAIAVRNLNRLMDINRYPSENAKRSCENNRPIGIGVRDVQGLLFQCQLPYNSARALELLEAVAETIYFSALSESNVLAVDRGAYRHFGGSLYSKGIMHQDLCERVDAPCGYCGLTARCSYCDTTLVNPPVHDWDGLRSKIKIHGLANSLTTALMPTAGTVQIFGDVESFDPVTSLAYGGEFRGVCKHVVSHLEELGLWNDDMSSKIVKNGGSVKGIEGVPQWIQDVYTIIWDVPQKARMRIVSRICRFVDQGVSFDVFLRNPDRRKYMALFLYAHRCGLPTANYYHRSRAVAAKKVAFVSGLEGGFENGAEPTRTNENDRRAKVTRAISLREPMKTLGSAGVRGNKIRQESGVRSRWWNEGK